MEHIPFLILIVTFAAFGIITSRRGECLRISKVRHKKYSNN